MIKKLFIFAILLTCPLFAKNMDKEFTTSSLKAMGAPNNPKVEIAWNRYYDHKELGELCLRLEKAFPNLVKYSSAGKSVKGRNIHVLTVTNFKKGKPSNKPAMYIDGNIHSNEIQGGEVSLYTAWYLVENYGHVDWITDLVDNKTFYILPTINPDARDYYIHEPNTMHSPRSGLLPRDDDGDGEYDEDGYDDLNNDGHIVMMRRKNPNGRYKADPDDPRIMVEVKPDEQGEYELLGWEGYDNDNDGEVNEDVPGFYDPNRNWAWNWKPSYNQNGADQYPFSIPENRAVAEFVKAHPNIAGAQSYHNAGGMILRGPGAKDDVDTFNRDDLSVLDFLGKIGEEMLPGYRYLVVYKDLYSVSGGELDWFYGARGIYTFSNELWTAFDYFRQEKTSWFGRQKDYYRFDKLLLFGEGIIDWQKVKHPQYGDIEIGGPKKSWVRTAPSFLLEDMCHRNMAFTLFHAYHLPQISVDSTKVTKISNDLYQVDVIIKNSRVIPTRSSHEVKNNITRPDFVSIKDSKKAVSAFTVTNPLLNIAQEQEDRPHQIKVPTIKGMDTVHVRWLMKSKPPYKIVVDSEKGGKIEKTIN